MVEDCIRLVRRVGNLTEDTVRIEGIFTVVARRTSSLKGGARLSKDASFETCVPVIITEDSIETSFQSASMAQVADHFQETDALINFEIEKEEKKESNDVSQDCSPFTLIKLETSKEN